MLKFLVFNLILMSFLMNWGLIQIGLLAMCFMGLLMMNHDFFCVCVGYMMGADYLSYILIVLSVWIMLMVYGSVMVKKVGNFYSGFLLVNLILLLVLVLTFSSVNYLMFYISFESSLVPMFVLILGWEYQPERIQAGIYMMFYTLFASLPLLVSLLSLYKAWEA